MHSISTEKYCVYLKKISLYEISAFSAVIFFTTEFTERKFTEKYGEKMKRKDFLKTGGRLLLLGGIVGSAGYLVVNKKVSASCLVSPTCKNCGKVTACENPEVKEARDGKEK